MKTLKLLFTFLALLFSTDSGVANILDITKPLLEQFSGFNKNASFRSSDNILYSYSIDFTTPEPEPVFPEDDDYLGWVREIDGLVETMKSIFDDMKTIAVKDNPEVGKAIEGSLDEEYGKAKKIADDFAGRRAPKTIFLHVHPVVHNLLYHVPLTVQTRLPITVHQNSLYYPLPNALHYGYLSQLHSPYLTTYHHYRKRRQAPRTDGKENYGKVGDLLTGTTGKIDADKKKLSPEAQQEMDDAYVEGLKKCKSRECKSQLKVYLQGKKG